MSYWPKRNWAQEFDEREDAREEARQERLRKEREEQEKKERSSVPEVSENEDKNQNISKTTDVQTRDSAPSNLYAENGKVLNDYIALIEMKRIQKEVAIAIAEPVVKQSEEVYKLHEGPNGQLSLFATVCIEKQPTRRGGKEPYYPPRKFKDLYYDLIENEA